MLGVTLKICVHVHESIDYISLLFHEMLWYWAGEQQLVPAVVLLGDVWCAGPGYVSTIRIVPEGLHKAELVKHSIYLY